ncbi:MAG: Hsp20 family protein [archaeon]|nr:Hsp20 family protein [archaeon]
MRNSGFFRAKSSYSGFYRKMSLPSKVMAKKAKTNYKNGVLEAVIPKTKK